MTVQVKTFKAMVEEIKQTRFLWAAMLPALLLIHTPCLQAADASSLAEKGRKIYLEGILTSGKTLKGKREAGVEVEGEAAACVKCHRPSGMGGLEGGVLVPPVTGRFLLADEDTRVLAVMDARTPTSVTRGHKPYTEKSFSRALKEGVRVTQAVMHPLMPRYELEDQDVRALFSYLTQLSQDVSPGVSEDKVVFATIITPDVSQDRREVMVSMMQKAFRQRNESQSELSGRMRMPLDLIPRHHRDWELMVWELKGEPQTWDKQLQEYYRKSTPFIVLSGLSSGDWSPIHQFCNAEKIPCLFPSTPLPATETGFYSLYFSRGVLLEADVLGQYLRDHPPQTMRRVIQIHTKGEASKKASEELKNRLNGTAFQVHDREISLERASIAQSTKDISDQDDVVLWLNAEELKIFAKESKKLSSSSIYVSDFLINGTLSSIPKAWLSRLHLIYPYELSQTRQKNQSMLEAWLKTWSLPVVDIEFQSEVFFNLLFVTDLSSQMLDNLFRDYLVERAEDMLGNGQSNMTAYPHLSLAPGQRFASRGAYLAHLDKDGKVVADTAWIVP